MARTIILGNRNSKELATKIAAELIEVPDIYENDFGVVNDFVVEKLKKAFDILVIDADNIQRADVALALGLFLRLSVTDVGANALVPIVFASDFTMKKYLHIKTYSQLLLTRNLFFQSRSNIILDAVSPLEAERYYDDFLDFVCVQPGPEVGRHSLANQWGAGVLDRLLNNGVSSDNEVLKTAAKSLFFKYSFVQTFSVADFLSGKPEARFAITNRPAIQAKGKRILLIDDEADKGWEYVLKKLVFTNEGDFDVIGHRVKNYEAFTKEEKEKIEKGNYDLIFLDLRMNGVEEENVYKPEDFSGMKILKQIKKNSPGTQIIMFTASNKAWNLKALLDAGANGYYIKESPEYKFSLGFSLANYDALRDNVKDCLRRSYLRNVDFRIKSIKKDFNKTFVNRNFKASVINQLESSYVLLEARHFEFAYISLYQAVELINDEYLDMDENGTWFIKDSGEDAKSWTINIHKECIETKTNGEASSKYPEWQKMASLYYQLWGQTNKAFGYQLQTLINERNKFMHNESNKNSPIHSETGYLDLLEVIVTICSFI